MKTDFVKMHGCGNDFIIFHDADDSLPKNAAFIKKICARTRGVGADGVIFLRTVPGKKNKARMDFFNSDGSRASMCGNGLRCAGAFAAKYMGLSGGPVIFETDAAELSAEVLSGGLVRIEIPLIRQFERIEPEPGLELFFGDTGVPHAVSIEPELDSADVFARGRYIRNHKRFAPAGTNANFIALSKDKPDEIKIRTYERGVEAETCACGTGCAAAAVCAAFFFGKGGHFKLITKDNDIIHIDLSMNDNILKKIYLTAPAEEAFCGTVSEANN